MAQPANLAQLLNMDEDGLASVQELLTYSAQSAFGFTPDMASTLAVAMINAPVKPYDLMIGCMSAVGQTKENLKDNDIMDELEDMFNLSTNDKGSKSQTVNFSAVRLIGYLLIALFKDNIVALQKLNDKAKNPWLDTSFDDSEAGRINRELRNSFANWTLPVINPATKTEVSQRLALAYQGITMNYSQEKANAFVERVAARMARFAPAN